MYNELSLLTSKIFKNIYLWAIESYKRSILVVFLFVIFGFPAIEYLQNLVRKFPYVQTLSLISTFFIKNFSFGDYIVTLVFLIIAFTLYRLYLQLLKTRVISERFDQELSAWSIPLDAGWTTQDCGDALGKMLGVTNSYYPGTLKEASGWYDYEVSFLAKIDKNVSPNSQNFSVVVRSENTLNGVMLQITKTHLQPHLLFNGTFILDRDNFLQLPTILKTDEWIKVKLYVKGNNIDIWLYNYKLQYKIPTKVYEVENLLLKRDLALKELEKSDNEISDRRIKIVAMMSNIEKIKEPNQKQMEEAKLHEAIKKFPTTTRVILEYQKGAVGFRESGAEHAYFRNLTVKKI